MKLKYHFEMMELDNEVVAVPLEDNTDMFRGVIKLNGSAVAVFELLQTETDEATIIEELKKKYSSDSDEMAAFVHDYLEELNREGLLQQ